MNLAKSKVQQLLSDIHNRPSLDIFKGCFMWFSVVASAVIIASIVLVLFPFVYLIDRERHSLHAFANAWGKIIQVMNPWWNFHVFGKENFAKKGQAVIYVANHQSQADILAIFTLSTRFRWLSKASLFKIPWLGWAMTVIGYVPVIRNSKISRERCMRISAEHLKRGTPMVFFPEGTRSKTGELGEFKNGAFRLAVSLGIPVVPITLNGCASLLPKGSLLPRTAHVTIHIHKPIYPQNLSPDELMIEARKVIAEQLNKDHC